MRKLSWCLAICIVWLGLSPSSAAAVQGPCALANSTWPNPQPLCSTYTVVPVRVIASYPRNAFYGVSELGAMRALGDGSAIVEESPYALFRASGRGLASVLWAPAGSRYYNPTASVWISRPGASPTNYYSAPNVHVWINESPPPPTPKPPPPNFTLLGSFDNTAMIEDGSGWIYGIRSDGAVDFKFFRANTEMNENPTLLGRDPEGTLWFESGSKRSHRDTIYALFLPKKNLVALASEVQAPFQGPSGFIYARIDRNLVELRSVPGVRAQYYRGPILLKPSQGVGADDVVVSQIGADGSAWASTPVQVIHEHPNGIINVIGLSRYPTTIAHIPSPLSVHLAPDGSALIASGTKLVRITNDDRVEVMTVPSLGFYPEVQVAADNTVWFKTADNGGALVHIALPPG